MSTEFSYSCDEDYDEEEQNANDHFDLCERCQDVPIDDPRCVGCVMNSCHKE